MHSRFWRYMLFVFAILISGVISQVEAFPLSQSDSERVPEITLNPTSIRQVVAVGESASDSLTIGNSGTEALDWSLGELPAWLTATPSEGTVAADGEQVVTLLFSEHVQLQTYTGTLTINSNDPDDGTLEVPISLKVMPPEIKYTDSEPEAEELFGASLAVDGERLVVGIPEDNLNGRDEVGAIIIYRWNGEAWEEELKSGSNSPTATDSFGAAVSIDGDVVLVGDPTDRTAYVFRWYEEFSTWHGDVISPSSGASLFGRSVSVNGDWMIVGAPRGISLTSGSAYIFRWDEEGKSWQEETMLMGDQENDNNFGVSVAISGDIALVGASLEGINGYVYVYRRQEDNSWQRETKLSASDSTPFDLFGARLSLDGEVALIGAFEHDSTSGAAYVFRFDGSNWQEETKLVANDENAPRGFGTSVSIVGDKALVGAIYDGENGTWAGAAYLFSKQDETWQQERKLLATDGASGDEFGSAVALTQATGTSFEAVDADLPKGAILPFEFLPSSGSGQGVLPPETAFIGAPRDDEASEDSGAVYQYDLSATVSDLTIAPASQSVAVVEGSSRQETLTLHNNSGDTIAWVCADSCGGSSWLNVSPTSGSISPHQSQPLTVDFNAADLEREHYTDTLSISSDAPDGTTIHVPIEFTVIPPEQPLFASDGAAGHEFGQAVSVGGGYVLIGATPDDFESEWPGAAYLYSSNGRHWQEETAIMASDGTAGDGFGRAVGVSGSYLAIGAPFEDDLGENSGAVYFYSWNGTSLTETKVTASDGAAGDFFGLSVSIQSGFAFIGAPFNDTVDDNAGAVYVFRFNDGNWEEIDKLILADGDAFDYFGSSVSVDMSFGTETALIAAVGEQNGATQYGAAYIYRWDGKTWEQAQELFGSQGGANTQFAGAVSITRNLALIAHAGDNNNGTAYFYRFNGTSWVEDGIFTGNDTGLEAFGSSVSLSQTTALIGSKEAGNGRGAVMKYRREGEIWQPDGLLKASDGADNDNFGTAVDLGYEHAFIGAPKKDAPEQNSGAAYIYDLSIDELELVATEGDEGIDLTWNIIKPLAGELGVYQLYRSIGDDGEAHLISLTADSQHTDPDVVAGTEYCYHVEAVDSDEIMIGDSNIVCVRYGENEIFLPLMMR